MTSCQPKIMGVVNTSPDSFSDGGFLKSSEAAIKHSLKLYSEGADIIDIGGESTRPGSNPVSIQEELNRVVPVVEKLRSLLPQSDISVDTYKSEVARQSIEAGANIINDISSLQFDERMVDVLRHFDTVRIVLMHIRGTPKNMQDNPVYKDVVADIISFLSKRIDYCLLKGIALERIYVDPGIGFGKTLTHNLEIIRRLREFKVLQRPVILGASRKSFINAISTSKPQQRLAGSLAATAYAVLSETDVIRVHDVKEHKQFIAVFKTIENGRIN